ncbi:MAG: hypothetical protein JXR37_01505 [Kiritimatiellae bacterium]|nr:hypothetical protein [Kiritimatiellia bacterium]
MDADAKRLKWRWILAAVGEDGTVVVMDPSKARQAREVRVDAKAAIANLPKWLDEANTT